MSVPRVYSPRVLRLHLSKRYHYLQQRRATTASQSSPKPTFFSRNKSAISWSAFGLTLGVAGGQYVVHTIAPPALPEIGTREDSVLLADLNQQIDENFKVKVLRGKCLGMAKQLRGEGGGWVEVISPPAELDENKEVSGGLVSQLKGAKGFGVERLFWDRSGGQLVAVMWFGGALCGWPGVTHGGAVATALAEKLSMAAALASASSSEILAGATPQRLPGTGNHAKMLVPTAVPAEPGQITLTYKKPTYANNFYVLRVVPALPTEGTPGDMAQADPYGGADYEATLETLDAQICAKARAKFAPSTVIQRKGKEVELAAKQSYTTFKEWMWPSRQQQSQIR